MWYWDDDCQISKQRGQNNAKHEDVHGNTDAVWPAAPYARGIYGFTAQLHPYWGLKSTQLCSTGTVFPDSEVFLQLISIFQMGRAAERKVKGHHKHFHLLGCVGNSHFIIYEGWKYFIITFSRKTLLSSDFPGNGNLLRWDKLHNEVSSHQDSSDSERPALGSALSSLPFSIFPVSVFGPSFIHQYCLESCISTSLLKISNFLLQLIFGYLSLKPRSPKQKAKAEESMRDLSSSPVLIVMTGQIKFCWEILAGSSCK